MFSTTRSLLAGQRDASKRVAEAQRFSIKLPLVGPVRVPPPDQLAFLGALGALVALELIDWPLALAMGIGSVVVSHQLSSLKDSEPKALKTPSSAEAPAKKAPAKKAPAKKAPAKKAAPRKR